MSPLYWAVRDGKVDMARVMLRDLLVLRADREAYYYGYDQLWALHPDLVTVAVCVCVWVGGWVGVCVCVLSFPRACRIPAGLPRATGPRDLYQAADVGLNSPWKLASLLRLSTQALFREFEPKRVFSWSRAF